MSSIINLAKAVLSAVPGAPDGLRESQTLSSSEAFTESSTYASVSSHLPLNGKIVQNPPFQPLKEMAHDLIHQVWNGNVFKDAMVALQAITSAGSPTDDRELLMEHLVSRLAQMDPEVQLREKITDVFVKGLWEDLPHPVSSLISDEYRFRQADGSHNNMFEPTLGAAGRPYARSVPPLHPKMPNLPDPETVFNCLLKRDKFVPHPSGISSMLFANAVIIVHSIFRTRYDNPMINDASGYLDLSPLYGNNLDEQYAVRDRSKCLGLLYPDTVSESRLFLMPPQVVAYLVLFNRNHNYIADMLFRINEKGKYKDPSLLNPDDKASVKHFEWQEKELFETARLINCGHFIQITLHDYVASILGTNQIETNWFLDPMKEISGLGGKVERGTGNVCAVEFNILYRWHSTMSQADAKWFADFMTEKSDGKPAESLSMMDFLRIAKKEVQKFEEESDPTEWVIPGLTRDPNTLKYNDDDLARILTAAIEEPAAAFRACGIPEAMRPIDCLGIVAARETYGLCTLNEFRRSIGLREYKTFEEWNPDPEVAKIAEQLYIHPDNLELYPGLLAEGTKPKMLGSGLAVGRTVSRAILSDAVSLNYAHFQYALCYIHPWTGSPHMANPSRGEYNKVALVRGDRFFTVDYNVATLTSWGMEYISPNFNDGTKGGLLGKLFLRNLPRHFRYNSIHALFPFQTPQSMAKLLTQQGTAMNYTFATSAPAPQWKAMVRADECVEAARDTAIFTSPYNMKLQDLGLDKFEFMLSADPRIRNDEPAAMMKKVFWPNGYDDEFKIFFTKITAKLVKEHSFKLPGTHTYMVDVVRDVGNLAPIYWMSTYLGIPLKTKEHPLGVITPQELYMATAAISAYIFDNFFDSTVTFKLRSAAKDCIARLRKMIAARILEVKALKGPFELLLGARHSLFRLQPEAVALYRRLLATEKPLDDMVSAVLCVMVFATQRQGHIFAHNLNLCLEPEHADAKDTMQRIAKVTGQDTDDMFRKYCWEVMRLAPQSSGIIRRATAATSATGLDGNEVAISGGDLVWISMTDANTNPEIWENPDQIDPLRKSSLYADSSVTLQNDSAARTSNIAQPTMLREIMKLKNIRRAPGKAGILNRATKKFANSAMHTYFNHNFEPFPYPTNMTIMYEA